MKTKEPKEKEMPKKCACGNCALMVKHKSKFMYCCPDTLSCSLRSTWCSSEDLAIKNWNTVIEEELYKRRRAKK